MTKPMVRIHDIATNEIIDREMTDEEFTQYQIDQLAWQQAQDLLDAQVAKKAALLERLGITADEAALLLG
jgi:hypothetical protein